MEYGTVTIRNAYIPLNCDIATTMGFLPPICCISGKNTSNGGEVGFAP